MLAARNRMRRRLDFQAATRGRRAGRRTLVAHLAISGSSPAADPLVGFVVSRAVGPATVRNQVRRRLRHLVAPYLATLPPGTQLVLRVLPPAASAPAAELRTDLDRALGRLLAMPIPAAPPPVTLANPQPAAPIAGAAS